MSKHGQKTVRAALVVLGLSVGAGACRQDMHDAPRYDPLEASATFTGGASARPLVAGTVARGHMNDDALLVTGMGADGKPSAVFPFPITRADLDRGEQRFNIYCTPCHGLSGQGDGMVVRRGYRPPASFHDARLRGQPDGYFFDVMTSGFGAMPDYSFQLPVADRWAVVAYIRALQLSQNATAADVPADKRATMDGAAAPPAPAPLGEAR